MANSSPLHAVIVRLGDARCALPAGIVREVLPRFPATRIPGAGDAIEGLVNVRGRLVTVLDGFVLLRQPRRHDDEGAIVLLEVEGRRCGLAVAQVLDFVELPREAVADGGELPGIDARLASGAGIHEGQPFVLLNIDALVAPFLDRR